jgi:hypothetical protein
MCERVVETIAGLQFLLMPEAFSLTPYSKPIICAGQ